MLFFFQRDTSYQFLVYEICFLPSGVLSFSAQISELHHFAITVVQIPSSFQILICPSGHPTKETVLRTHRLKNTAL